jgi:hypothetical protein
LRTALLGGDAHLSWPAGYGDRGSEGKRAA